MNITTKKSDKDPFTRVPHWYFRDFMQYANDTQFKIVGFVIDQTKGWGKPYDITTLGHIAKRIGRCRDAVSRNIQAVIEVGALALVNERGEILDTPAKRKRSGVARLPTIFAVPKELVLTQDKIDRLVQPVSRTSPQDKLPPYNKTTHSLNMRHNKRNYSKRNKETIKAPLKKHQKVYEHDRCQKCGAKVDGSQRMRSLWKEHSVRCQDCSKLTIKR